MYYYKLLILFISFFSLYYIGFLNDYSCIKFFLMCYVYLTKIKCIILTFCCYCYKKVIILSISKFYVSSLYVILVCYLQYCHCLFSIVKIFLKNKSKYLYLKTLQDWLLISLCPVLYVNRIKLYTVVKYALSFVNNNDYFLKLIN